MEQVERLLRMEFQRTDRPMPTPEQVRTWLACAHPRPSRSPEITAAVFLIIYAAFAVQRHHRMETGGYDLGIFEQIVRGYAIGHAPIADLKGPGYNALGDHFHPIVALLAPVYRLCPAAETLLVAQAGLLAVSIIPIGRAATAELGAAAGGIVSVAYGLAWGLQEAVGFDFHEICFAVPLMAASLNRLLAGRWNAAAAWVVPLVAVKEDLPLTIAAMGAYLILRGRQRLGAALVVGGLTATAVIVGWVLPWFNPEHTYTYAEQLGRSTQGWGLATKLSTVVLLLVPTLGVAVRSPLLLMAAPTLVWRFAADNHLYWGDHFHYNAVLMPIVFAALIDGLRPLRGRLRTTVVAGCVIVALALTPWRPLWQSTSPQFWSVPPAVSTTRHALGYIPDGATVAATHDVAVQLTGRCRVQLLQFIPPSRQDAQWVAVGIRDALSPDDLRDWVVQLRAFGYQSVYVSDTLTLLRRVP